MEVASRLGLGLIFLVVLANCSSSSTPAQQGNLTQSDTSCASSAIPNQYIVKWKNGHVTKQTSTNHENFLASVAAQANQIDTFEQDHMIVLDEKKLASSNDSTAPVPNWGQTLVQAPAVWTAGVTGAGVVVAVVDSGVDYTHPQLAAQIWQNPGENGTDAHGADKATNGIDDDGNGFIDDSHGYNWASDDDPSKPQLPRDPMDTNEHGTHVSGIIAALHSAGPIQGMAEGAKIMPLRFINASGSGAVSDAITAIQYAAANGAKVINASWGGTECSTVLQTTIAGLQAKGVMFVAAAGNDGVNLDTTPEYPAAYNSPNQMTIIATTQLDVQAEFSNYSFTLTQLGAPGTDIVSTVPGNATASLSGTSMATPFVAGAVALLWSALPTATIAQIRVALTGSVDAAQIADSAGGRLDVKKALDTLVPGK